MKLAIDEALMNINRGGGPFGAVIVKGGKMISSCSNRVTIDNDPTAHAEILAIREAAETLGTWDLSDCEIYSSCEPCPMCLGAIYWAHIPIVYYGANRDDAREAGFDDSEIYEELKKDLMIRKVRMRIVFRDRAIQVFQKWKKSSEKKLY